MKIQEIRIIDLMKNVQSSAIIMWLSGRVDINVLISSRNQIKKLFYYYPHNKTRFAKIINCKFYKETALKYN